MRLPAMFRCGLHSWRRGPVLAGLREFSEQAHQKVLSQERLEKFLVAEVSHFAQQPIPNLTLEYLLTEACSPKSAARCVHSEISKHFARRIRAIEAITGWDRDPDLTKVHWRYSESFREIRMAEVFPRVDLAGFTKVVQKLKERQRPVLLEMGSACHRIRAQHRGYDQEFWNSWMGTFLRSRIATEMLTSQYLAVVRQTSQGREAVTGIVNLCDPATICHSAVMAARMLSQKQFGVEPEVEVETRSKLDVSFSYIPVYLHYILLEVLKNSVAASARASAKSSVLVNEIPIHVVICSDDQRVAVRVRDLAGGIPFEVGERVWDFLYSGRQKPKGDAYQHSTPLEGYGIGLPLARLYAQYLGGTLELVSLPDYGVDTHLCLPRISSAPWRPDDDACSSDES